jgi:enoyl-CoA hydratase/carnithine racemase
VVVPDDLVGAVDELARSIAANAPLTVSAVKASLQELRRPSAERDLDRVAALVEGCFQSEDYREGQRAFAARRPPLFHGR